MPTRRIDLVDETFVDAAPGVLRPLFDDPRRLAMIWPHLTLELIRDRGDQGLRWRVSGAAAGTMEVWLEPWWEGAIVHHYLRGVRSAGQPADLQARHTRRWKRAIHGIKDGLENNSM